MSTNKLKPHESTPENNPNHPLIRCVDGLAYEDPNDTDAPYEGDGQFPPFWVFDVLNQEHVGPKFNTREEAEAYMRELNGKE